MDSSNRLCEDRIMAKEQPVHPIEQELAGWHEINKKGDSYLSLFRDNYFERQQLKFLHQLIKKYGEGKSPEDKQWIAKIQQSRIVLYDKLKGNIWKEIKTIWRERHDQRILAKMAKELEPKPTMLQRLGGIYGRIFTKPISPVVQDLGRQVLQGVKLEAQLLQDKLSFSSEKEANTEKERKKVEVSEGLIDLLNKKGYGRAVKDLRAALEKGETDFSVKIGKIVGADLFTQQLNFAVADDQIKFYSVDTIFKDDMNPGQSKTLSLPVDGLRSFSSMDSIRLAKGETICRLEHVDDKHIEKKLYQVNPFDLKHNHPQKEVKRFIGRPEELIKGLDALPLAQKLTTQEKATLIEGLLSGQTAQVLLKHDNISMKVNLSVGHDGRMSIRDLGSRSVTLSQIKQHLDVSEAKTKKQSAHLNVGKSKGVKAA